MCSEGPLALITHQGYDHVLWLGLQAELAKPGSNGLSHMQKQVYMQSRSPEEADGRTDGQVGRQAAGRQVDQLYATGTVH